MWQPAPCWMCRRLFCVIKTNSESRKESHLSSAAPCQGRLLTWHHSVQYPRSGPKQISTYARRLKGWAEAGFSFLFVIIISFKDCVIALLIVYFIELHQFHRCWSRFGYWDHWLILCQCAAGCTQQTTFPSGTKTSGRVGASRRSRSEHWQIAKWLLRLHLSLSHF